MNGVNGVEVKVRIARLEGDEWFTLDDHRNNDQHNNDHVQ